MVTLFVSIMSFYKMKLLSLCVIVREKNRKKYDCVNIIKFGLAIQPYAASWEFLERKRSKEKWFKNWFYTSKTLKVLLCSERIERWKAKGFHFRFLFFRIRWVCWKDHFSRGLVFFLIEIRANALHKIVLEISDVAFF